MKKKPEMPPDRSKQLLGAALLVTLMLACLAETVRSDRPQGPQESDAQRIFKRAVTSRDSFAFDVVEPKDKKCAAAVYNLEYSGAGGSKCILKAKLEARGFMLGKEEFGCESQQASGRR